MTHIEVLSSYNPVPGFKGGTAGQTAVTKMEMEKKTWILTLFFLHILSPMASISEVGSQKHFKKWGKFYRFFFVFFFLISLHPKLNLSVQRNFPVNCFWINTLHVYV